MTSCLLLLFLATKNYAVSCAVSAKIDGSAKIRCVSKKLAELSKCLMMTQQKIAEKAKICCRSKNQLIQQNMLCQQNLISQHKYMVITQQKYVISTKHLDKSVKWADSAKIRWVSKICCVSKIYGSVKMPGGDSAKTCCISKNCHLRFENGKRRNRCL